MKRAIITGATGAVGTALIRELIMNNTEVLVFCREGSVRNKHIPIHSLVKKVYCPLDKLADQHNDTKKSYDVFYHFAWEGTTGAARNDMHLQNRNVEYAIDAVAAAKHFGCRTFIGAGSQAEYGRVEGLIRHDTSAHPETGYGIGKLCAGLMTREYAHQLGMRHIWVRILSVYGPNDGSQSMIMSTIEKLKIGETPQFTKGEQMWDYLFSGDAAKAFYLLGCKGIDGKTYVLGSGKAKPLSAYMKEIRDIVAPYAKLDIGAIPYAEKQIMHLQADISEINKDIGFEPETPFASGIRYTARKF
jgi:nucleoside-diphosphate-sugar epimerase